MEHSLNPGCGHARPSMPQKMASNGGKTHATKWSLIPSKSSRRPSLLLRGSVGFVSLASRPPQGHAVGCPCSQVA